MALDSDPGVGIGSPITCTTPGAAPTIAQPYKPTILSLAYYAHIMGISPVHFQGADAVSAQVGFVPFDLEQALESPPLVDLVLDDQNPGTHVRRLS